MNKMAFGARALGRVGGADDLSIYTRCAPPRRPAPLPILLTTETPTTKQERHFSRPVRSTCLCRSYRFVRSGQVGCRIRLLVIPTHGRVRSARHRWRIVLHVTPCVADRARGKASPIWRDAQLYRFAKADRAKVRFLIIWRADKALSLAAILDRVINERVLHRNKMTPEVTCLRQAILRAMLVTLHRIDGLLLHAPRSHHKKYTEQPNASHRCLANKQV